MSSTHIDPEEFQKTFERVYQTLIGSPELLSHPQMAQQLLSVLLQVQQQPTKPLPDQSLPQMPPIQQLQPPTTRSASQPPILPTPPPIQPTFHVAPRAISPPARLSLPHKEHHHQPKRHDHKRRNSNSHSSLIPHNLHQSRLQLNQKATIHTYAKCSMHSRLNLELRFIRWIKYCS